MFQLRSPELGREFWRNLYTTLLQKQDSVRSDFTSRHHVSQDENRKGKVSMSLRKTVTGMGVALVIFGMWTLARTHSRVGVCTPLTGARAGAGAGIDSLCAQTLMSYLEGFVFVASGVIVVIIAFTMIARRARLDLHAELHAVPRTWSKAKYVITSESLDDDHGTSASTSIAPKVTDVH